MMAPLAPLSPIPALCLPPTGLPPPCAHRPPARLLQLCVWRLGAPTAAMFFGLRLVFAVILSDPILGSTVIQTGVQVSWLASSCHALCLVGAAYACCFDAW